MSNGEPQWWYDQFDHGPFLTLTPIPMKTLPLRGKTVAMTGTLSIPRHDFAILLEYAGAVVSTSLNKQTDVLIIGADPGDAKLTKARQNGTLVWDEQEARAVMDGSLPSSYGRNAKVASVQSAVYVVTGTSESSDHYGPVVYAAKPSKQTLRTLAYDWDGGEGDGPGDYGSYVYLSVDKCEVEPA